MTLRTLVLCMFTTLFPRAADAQALSPGEAAVLDSVGMEHSSFDPLFAMTFPHAQGHETRGQTPSVVRPFHSYPPFGPAGELLTTVDDLGRLARALLNDGLLDGARVLPAGVLTEMARARGHGGALLGGTRDYGLGVMIRTHRGIEIIEHEGVYSGFGASFVLAPQRGLAAIGVVNGRYSFPARTTQAAIEIAAGMAPSPTEAVTVHISPRDSLGALGVYTSVGDTVEILTADEGLALRQGARTYCIAARQEGHWELPGYPGLLPIPSTPLEIVRSDGEQSAPFIRIAWRLYRRVEDTPARSR